MWRVLGRVLMMLGVLGGVTMIEEAHAGFAGQTVHSDYLFPTQSDVFVDLGNAVVGPGIEFNSYGQTNYDLSDTRIDITNSDGRDITFSQKTFNGVSFFEVFATIDPIVGVTIDPVSNLSGFDASRVSFDANHIFVNLQGLVTQADTLVRLDVQFATSAVPAPATSILLVAGLGGLGAARAWRRR